MSIRRVVLEVIGTVAAAALIALPQAATAAEKRCPSSGNTCKVQLKLVNGKPSVADDPIVIVRGKRNVHINWRAPAGWEFRDGGAGLKSASAEFDQWCATDTDNDACTARNAKGRQYHCRALNRSAGEHAYRLRLHRIGTNEEHEIDPIIVNQG
jgi:hypothetical protein